jgi:hypothetical protein
MAVDKKQIRARIDELLEQHRELDEAIVAMLAEDRPDELRIKRLKKEKLQRKDEIAALEDQLFPDIIA